MKFSEQLKKYRDDNGLTQQQMADKMDLSLRMYQYYEKGDFDGVKSRVKKYLDLIHGMNGKKVDFGERVKELEEERDMLKKYIKVLEGKLGI